MRICTDCKIEKPEIILVCSKCKQALPCTEFNKRGGRKRGFSSHCKKCIKEYDKDWYDNKGGKERAVITSKLWRGRNKDYIALKSKGLRESDPEKAYAPAKNWRKNNPDKYLTGIKQWQTKNPDKQRIISKRHQTIRRRELGFRPLNSWFEGSVAHHINKDDVIYIPEEIHKFVAHDVKTGRGMDIINKLAFVSCVMLTGQTVRGDF